MNDEERRQLEELRTIKQRRVRVLEEQAARLDAHAPPHIVVELDTLRAEITGLDARLGADAALRLPEPVADFVGRAEEIERLARALGGTSAEGRAAAISGVRGLGGVGKTQLAYAVARRLADSFPDGRLQIALRGASPNPMTAAQALQTVILAFDRAAHLPDDLAQLQARYHAALKGKRMLILADDARDAAQVRPLLPPAGCALLVTSRFRFTLPGMVACDLGALLEDQAVALVLGICPRIGATAGRLARLCGCLPLALRVSASVLANDDTLNVARYLERLERERLDALRDPDDPDADVEASLQLSFDALDGAARAALCRLGVFAGSFELGAAEAVVLPLTPSPSPTGGEGSKEAAGEGSEAVADVLGRLRRRSLMEWDAEVERYRLHDLMRAFAAGRMEDGEAVRLRYARYYAAVARQASELYDQGGASLLAGLALFDQERANIDAGWSWARERAGSVEADQMQGDYAHLTAYIGLLRYDERREQIPQLEASIEAARRIGNKGAEGASLGNLGNTYVNLDKVHRAIEYFEQALRIFQEIEYRHGEGNVLICLGIAYGKQGMVHRAIEYFEQALRISQVISNRRSEGSALCNLGIAYTILGELPHAIEYFEQALRIFQEIGYRHGEGNALGGLGNAYGAIDESSRAIEHYEQWLTITRKIGDRYGEGSALFNMSLVLDTLGDHAQAITYAEAALRIFEQIESPYADHVREQLAQWRDEAGD